MSSRFLLGYCLFETPLTGPTDPRALAFFLAHFATLRQWLVENCQYWHIEAFHDPHFGTPLRSDEHVYRVCLTFGTDAESVLFRLRWGSCAFLLRTED